MIAVDRERILRDRLAARGLDHVLVDVARDHHVLPGELLGRAKSALVTRARHMFWLELRAKGLSYPEIGILCDVDHTTVMSGVRRLGPGLAKRPPSLHQEPRVEWRNGECVLRIQDTTAILLTRAELVELHRRIVEALWVKEPRDE